MNLYYYYIFIFPEKQFQFAGKHDENQLHFRLQFDGDWSRHFYVVPRIGRLVDVLSPVLSTS